MERRMWGGRMVARVILVLLVAACEKVPVPLTSGDLPTPASTDLAVLHVTVVDKASGEPVEGAVVYIGYSHSESWRCHTDQKGECTIQNDAMVWGDYGVNAFKRGYEHSAESVHLKPGDNHVTIELRKKPQPPESVTVSGVLIEIVTAEGTRSENRYIQIQEDDGQAEFVFNEIGENVGFDEFINKRVEIQGFRDVGRVGWQAEEVEGIYVERIIEVESE